MQRVDHYGLVGQVLDGQFRVDAPIGEGGCSVVYRGHHLGLDAPVAIKCLKVQAQLGSAMVETFERRFRDESKLQYRLSQGSLHIVRTIAAGTTIAPATSALVPYMVLEWLDGFPLSEQLRARRERGERGRPLGEVMRLLEPAAEAMAFAHSLGVVHRDLNPGNIFVEMLAGGQSRLKVMDFGVAKVVSDHALSLGPRAATVGPIRMFTPAYGAPEQFNDNVGAIAPATDVYAFALVLVEMLLDRPAIDGESVGDFLERALDPLVRPTPWTLGAAGVGEAVERVFVAALSVDPAQRPADIGELWGALKNALARDEEASRRGASQPPPPGAPLTSKGTVILPATSPRAPSVFPPSVAPPSSATGKGGTRPMPMHPGPAGSQPPGSFTPPSSGAPAPFVAPETLAYGSVPSSALMAGPSAVVIPRGNPAVDAYGPTVDPGEGKQGASPLSTTVTPGEQLLSPELRAKVEAHWKGAIVDDPTKASAGRPPAQPAPMQLQPVLVPQQGASTFPGVGPGAGPSAGQSAGPSQPPGPPFVIPPVATAQPSSPPAQPLAVRPSKASSPAWLWVLVIGLALLSLAGAAWAAYRLVLS